MHSELYCDSVLSFHVTRKTWSNKIAIQSDYPTISSIIRYLVASWQELCLTSMHPQAFEAVSVEGSVWLLTWNSFISFAVIS